MWMKNGVNSCLNCHPGNYDWEHGDPISLTYDLIQDYDVFVMPTPMKTFTGSELSAIKQFVDNGGGLFLFTTLSETDWQDGQYVPPGERDCER